MRANFDKRWLLPLGILAASALVALGVVVFGPSFVARSSEEVAQRGASEAAADCSGTSASDYACQQERYRDLVRDSAGVEAAFAGLKDEYGKNELAKAECHQLAHVIGRAAAELYGDLAATYGRGDNFCFAGYYHGAMETFVAEIGAGKILEEADTLCADLRERQNRSFYHYNCVHGLGHGFMGVLGNELFEALEVCDALPDAWERENCYGGVFMENLMTERNTGNPSKYLDADQPLYPCTEVETRYKNKCYQNQTAYALKAQSNDFAKAFDLCATAVEDDFRPACYQGLGRAADGQSITDEAETEDACILGQDYDARANCLIGAVGHSIAFYQSDERAKALCESVEADLRDVCLRAVEEFYGRF